MDRHWVLHCLTLPPVKSCLFFYLCSMDTACLAISLGISLTENEQRRYLNPAKDVMDKFCFKVCPMEHLQQRIYLGRDLWKPITLVKARKHDIQRQRIEIHLLLLIGCLDREGGHLLLKCREGLVHSVEKSSAFEISRLVRPNDEKDNLTIVVPPIGTALYLFNPTISSSDRINSILYLDSQTWGSILDIHQPPARQNYIFEHTMEHATTNMCSDSFDIRRLFWNIRYPYYPFQLVHGLEEQKTFLNIFLVIHPGTQCWRRLWPTFETISEVMIRTSVDRS